MRKLCSFVPVAALVTACAVLLGGCQADEVSESEWEPQVSAVQPHLYMSEADLIMYPNQSETDALYAVVESFGKRCMTERGFGDVENAGSDVARVLKARDEKAVRDVYGYVAPEDVATQGVASRGWYESLKRPQQPEVTPDYENALYGKTADGKPTPDSCQGQAIEKYLPGFEKQQEILDEVQNLNLLADQDAEYRKVYQEALDRWAGCMEKAGYSQFKTVWSLGNPDGKEDSEDGWPAPNPGPEEVKVATASSNCMIDTGYLEDVSRANAYAVHRLMAKRPGLLTEWKEIRQKQIEAIGAN